MQSLTPSQEQLLVELYKASKRLAGIYRPARHDDLDMLENLLHLGLIRLEVEEVDDGDQWYAALSQSGLSIAEEIDNRPKMLGVEIEFNLKNAEQSALVEKLGELEVGEIPEVLAALFALDQSLQRGEIDALLTVYPDAVRTIRRMIQAGFEAELMTHEQQRIDQLLDEVSSLKSMLANPNGAAPKQIIPSPVDEDSEPIPAPKPVSLRPVLPSVPEGQPKQLNVPQFALPSDDEDSEDLFVVKKDEDAGRRASQNFIESLQKLQK